MRKLLLIPLLALLAGCVTYYYPAPESTVAVQYAPEDSVYDDYGLSVVSHDYVGSRYYPWWSMDYFYLGSGYYDSGFSIGFGTGYRPWHYDYSYYRHWYPTWNYDPWYYSYWYAPVHTHYSYYGYAHHNPYWHGRYRDYHRRYNRSHDYYYDDENRYARRHGRNDGDPEPGQDLVPPDDRSRERQAPRQGSMEPGPASRRVSVAPGDRSNERGMIVRSRDNAKPTRSRIEPVGSTAMPAGAGTATTRGNLRQPDLKTSVARKGPEQVRYRSDSKQAKSRTGPVTAPSRVTARPAENPASSRPANRAAPVVSSSHRSGMTVRAPNQGKVGKSRVQPVQSAPIQAPRAVRANPTPRQAQPQRSTPVQRSAQTYRSAPTQRSAPAQSSRPASSRPSASPRVSASAPRQARSSTAKTSGTRDRDRD
jgi:hypothetical protein